jgi:hypothetical protein
LLIELQGCPAQHHAHRWSQHVHAQHAARQTPHACNPWLPAPRGRPAGSRNRYLMLWFPQLSVNLCCLHSVIPRRHKLHKSYTAALAACPPLTPCTSTTPCAPWYLRQCCCKTCSSTQPHAMHS